MIQHSFKMNEHEKFKGAETKAEPRKIWRDPLLLFTLFQQLHFSPNYCGIDVFMRIYVQWSCFSFATEPNCGGLILQIQLILLPDSKWVKRFPSKNSLSFTLNRDFSIIIDYILYFSF